MEAEQPPAPTIARPAAEFAYRSPKSGGWKLLDADTADDDVNRAAEKSRESLEQLLLSSLKMEHLVVLAGSGCSLSVGGPSMGDLWKAVVGSPASETATSVASTTNYTLENDNIEAFLSHIDAWLSVANNAEVTTFLETAKKTILDKCSGFLAGASLSGHETLLHRLSRRRSRDQRLKLFTTNYDLCFEKAAGNIGGVAIDGFSFMAPRRYDPRYFDYDIVRRPRSANSQTNYLEGVLLLYKLHGSVNWRQTKDGIVEESNPPANEACLIYPARGKYQQSYNQPYLESISQYLSAIREPNTCILVVGFGFNDDHLSEPLLAAARSNPHLRLLVVDPSIKSKAEGGNLNRVQQTILELAEKGEDVWFINAAFEQFATSIPDLKSLTPPERLWNVIHSNQGAE
jgi:hypothetical protein